MPYGSRLHLHNLYKGSVSTGLLKNKNASISKRIAPCGYSLLWSTFFVKIETCIRFPLRRCIDHLSDKQVGMWHNRSWSLWNKSDHCPPTASPCCVKTTWARHFKFGTQLRLGKPERVLK